MNNDLDFNTWGNFLIRLGYLSGALRDPRIIAKLAEEGATPKQIDEAYQALVKLADCFFQIKEKANNGT